MALELSELRSFIALCKQRHFGRTAESLNISQPALSKQVRRLEDRLGGALLRGWFRATDRSGNNVSSRRWSLFGLGWD